MGLRAAVLLGGVQVSFPEEDRELGFPDSGSCVRIHNSRGSGVASLRGANRMESQAQVSDLGAQEAVDLSWLILTPSPVPTILPPAVKV